MQGRAADVLTFPIDRGEPVRIVPLTFVTLVERIPGIEQTQIVQAAPTTLRLAAGADPDRV